MRKRNCVHICSFVLLYSFWHLKKPKKRNILSNKNEITLPAAVHSSFKFETPAIYEIIFKFSFEINIKKKSLTMTITIFQEKLSTIRRFWPFHCKDLLFCFLRHDKPSHHLGSCRQGLVCTISWQFIDLANSLINWQLNEVISTITNFSSFTHKTAK